MFRKTSILIGLLALSPALMAFSGPLQEAERQGGIPWWVWVLIIVVLLALLIWWWQSTSRQAEEAAPAAPAREPAPAAPVEPDDLTRIEGIGPKISSVLQAAGIKTFAQLAATDPARLKEILTEAGLAALADPTTWPEQAGLAAAGKWDELEALQDKLKGGRRA